MLITKYSLTEYWSMWPFRRRADRVRCIACGESVRREDAREYDKYGDRWDREGKSFEYLCKPCDRELCRRSRADLENVLVTAGAGERSQEAFVVRYLALLEASQEPPEGR